RNGNRAGSTLMRSFFACSARFFAIALMAAVSIAKPITQKKSSPAKPQNPLELKAPGPGEEKAYKALQHFQSMPETDAPKKIQAAEDFLNKFPTTAYATYVYQYLTVAYIQAGQVDKGLAAGEKAL